MAKLTKKEVRAVLDGNPRWITLIGYNMLNRAGLCATHPEKGHYGDSPALFKGLNSEKGL